MLKKYFLQSFFVGIVLVIFTVIEHRFTSGNSSILFFILEFIAVLATLRGVDSLYNKFSK
ncbi:hypothetical protein [Orenia marismortui]|uniref:hypothetical protein n=1 Tax=Orenia marismortui TaxID=46469 RepID=UPI0003812A5C|nr:hypothetical protein [Orenia marismortui]